MKNTFVCQPIIESTHVKQSTNDELWESILLNTFPNTPKAKIVEAKWQAAMSWGLGENSLMSELYDKYVMVKRLREDPTQENENGTMEN